MRLSLLTPVLMTGLSFATMTQAADPDPQKAGRALLDSWNNTMKQKDAVAHAELYMEDAVQITPGGLISGRKAIEARTARTLKDFNTNPSTLDNSVILNGVMLRNGQWSGTSSNGNVSMKGYWSDVDVEDGGKWKIKQETYNVTPLN
jgi:ketosteroid isomerase-like protein